MNILSARNFPYLLRRARIFTVDSYKEVGVYAMLRGSVILGPIDRPRFRLTIVMKRIYSSSSQLSGRRLERDGSNEINEIFDFESPSGRFRYFPTRMYFRSSLFARRSLFRFSSLEVTVGDRYRRMVKNVILSNNRSRSRVSLLSLEMSISFGTTAREGCQTLGVSLIIVSLSLERRAAPRSSN